MTLHEIAFGLEALETGIAVEEVTSIRLVAIDDLLHLLFDLLEIFGSERGFAQKVVEESGVSGRTVTELGLWKEFQHGGGKQVRRRVMEDLERLGIFFGEQTKLGILLDGAGEIDDGEAIGFSGCGWAERRNFGGQCCVGQTRRNRLRNVEGGGAQGNFSNAAVGELNLDFRHRVGLRSRLRLRNADGFGALSLRNAARRSKPEGLISRDEG
jgi:hypothetical protein